MEIELRNLLLKNYQGQYDTEEKVDALGNVVLQKLLQTASEDPERFARVVAIVNTFPLSSIPSLPASAPRFMGLVLEKIEIKALRAGDGDVFSSGKFMADVMASDDLERTSNYYSPTVKVLIWGALFCCWYISNVSLSGIFTGMAIKYTWASILPYVNWSQVPNLLHASLGAWFHPKTVAEGLAIDVSNSTTIPDVLKKITGNVMWKHLAEKAGILGIASAEGEGGNWVEYDFTSTKAQGRIALVYGSNVKQFKPYKFWLQFDTANTPLNKFPSFYKEQIEGQGRPKSIAEMGVRTLSSFFSSEPVPPVPVLILSDATSEFALQTLYNIPLMILMFSIANDTGTQFDNPVFRSIYSAIFLRMLMDIFTFCLTMFQANLIGAVFGSGTIVLVISGIVSIFLYLSVHAAASGLVSHFLNKGKKSTQRSESTQQNRWGMPAWLNPLGGSAQAIIDMLPLEILSVPYRASKAIETLDPTLDYEAQLVYFLENQDEVLSRMDLLSERDRTWKDLRRRGRSPANSIPVDDYDPNRWRRVGLGAQYRGPLQPVAIENSDSDESDNNDNNDNNDDNDNNDNQLNLSQRRNRRFSPVGRRGASASAQVRRLLSHTRGNTEAAAQLLAKMYPLV
jgi:hypothetical protein